MNMSQVQRAFAPAATKLTSRHRCAWPRRGCRLALLLATAFALPAGPVMAECNRGVPKGLHVQMAATASPFALRENRSGTWYVGLTALPELRVKVDFGCWTSFFASAGYSGISTLLNSSGAPVDGGSSAVPIGTVPIYGMIGVGLDVPRMEDAASVTTGLHQVVFGLGFANVPADRDSFHTGPMFVVGFATNLVNLNFPYQEDPPPPAARPYGYR